MDSPIVSVMFRVSHPQLIYQSVTHTHTHTDTQLHVGKLRVFMMSCCLFSLVCQAVPHTPLLENLTKDHPTPPLDRRLPSQSSRNGQQSASRDEDIDGGREEQEQEENHTSDDDEDDDEDDDVQPAVWGGADNVDEQPLMLSTANAMMASSSPIVNSSNVSV